MAHVLFKDVPMGGVIEGWGDHLTNYKNPVWIKAVKDNLLKYGGGGCSEIKEDGSLGAGFLVADNDEVWYEGIIVDPKTGKPL